jgi:Zn-finger nucleic acid-binding protein
MVNYDVITKKAELSYDSCGTCGSLWLDAGELDKMAFQVEGSIEYSSEEEDRCRPVSESGFDRSCTTFPGGGDH